MNINTDQTNNSIGCNVTECKYHAGSQSYCTLTHIDVTKNKPNAECATCTDCSSFQLQ